MTTKRGVPKRDGSGGGTRRNKGRGDCPPSEQPRYGNGRNTGNGNGNNRRNHNR